MANKVAEYFVPVWATDGGGLVKEVAPGLFKFVEPPQRSNFMVGDTMPADWGLAPGNQLAMDELERLQTPCDFSEARHEAGLMA